MDLFAFARELLTLTVASWREKTRLGTLRKDSIADERQDCDNPVTPRNLLAFPVFAAIVRDRHLIDANALAQDARCNFRLEFETARSQGHAFQHVSPKDLVAGLHVAQDRIE